jgi:hypothetical protein
LNTLQAYNLIIKLVTDANNLAANLRDDKVTKKDALATFKELLTATQAKLD